MMNKVLTGVMMGVTLAGFANEVPVVMQSGIDGSVIEEREVETGTTMTTVAAPSVSGYIFTGWTSSDTSAFASCDRLGRALEKAKQTVYGETRLTANYLAEDIDSDGDGIADGYEIYWYGNLDETAESDTDHDGYDFAAELAAGTDPLMADRGTVGGIVWDDGEKVQYNPQGLPSYTIRSEPEGQLFETICEYVKPGTAVTTSSYGTDTAFAYWTTNGVRVADRHGRARDSVTFTMGENPVEVVAVCEDDADLRQQLYWYGKAIDPASDTDGDGYTFAEEIAAGTDPLMADRGTTGGIVWDNGEKVLYNPLGLQQYVIRSEPEGTLFASVTNIVKAGTEVTTESYATDLGFAYWTFNGERVADRYGRAKDRVTFTMGDDPVAVVAVCEDDADLRKQLYWYGKAIDPASDTDGDGYTFAEEIAAETDPLMADRGTAGGIVWDDGEMLNVNFQLYEQPQGAVVDGGYEELFFSPYGGNAATSRTFAGGAQVWPVVADVNGDGLWDMIVVSAVETNVFVNTGTKGNPKFSEEVKVKSEELWRVIDLQMNSTEKLAGMTLDVEPVGALSATTNGAAMLVSDDEGRIWLYEGTEAAEETEGTAAAYTLAHKVWGGSFGGFAEGLMLAAVDWEDDGDLDCLCGTAEGKLMLLRDPKVGRPTGLTAEAGVDNVLLTWEPNGQSRVRGYRVYRADGGSEDFGVRGAPALPTWRDTGLSAGTYDYKVSALSRFYTAGNSAPTETESVATDPVRAELGKVAFRWSDAAGFVGDEIRVDLGIRNSLNLAGEGLALTIGYDASTLQPVRVDPSGLTTNVTFCESSASGVWTVTATGGEIAAGGGTFFSFVFRGLAETNMTPVALTSVTMRSVGGATVPAIMPTTDAQVKVEQFIEPEPTHAQVTMTESAQVTAGESFTVAVSVTGEDIDASTLAFDYVFDDSLLARNGNSFTAADVKSETMTTITLTNVMVKATDGSTAVVDSIGACSVAIAPKSGGESGHFANLSLGSAKGKTGETIDITVRIKGAFKTTVVDLKTWRFEVSYDEQLMKPVGIEATDGTYGWTATNGVMSVVGTSGTLDIGKLLSGWKCPLALRFELLKQYAKHQTLVSFESVEMRATNGDKILTPIRECGSVYIEFVRPKEEPTVVVPYGRGDLNGDGRLTNEDKRLLAELMNGKGGRSGGGKNPTAEQLRAGDYNGNGRLDQNDYQLMKDDFKARGIK